MDKNMYYEQNRNLEEEDMGHHTSLYAIEIYDNQYIISLGKERKLITKPHHYYFPVYLMNKEYVQCQIGAFEYESRKENHEERLKSFKDSDGDLDLNRHGELLFYNFADRDFFDNCQLQMKRSDIAELEHRVIENKNQNKDTFETTPNENHMADEEESPFDISDKDLQRDTAIAVLSNSVLKDGLFDIDKTIKRPDMLSEETKDMSAEGKKTYRENSRGYWVERYMRNNQYEIVDTNSDGLYEAVALAYAQIGYKTTVKKLRALVATEITESIYVDYRDQYSHAYSRKDTLEQEKRQLYNTNKELKKRVLHMGPEHKAQKNELIKEANAIAIKYNHIKEELDTVGNSLKEMSFMDGVDSIEKFRELVETLEFPIQPWTISILEKKLNAKFILLSQEEYEEGDDNNVLVCHKRMNKKESEERTFTPDFYILLSHKGNHYDLVSFKYKRILRFSEVPYDIKILVVRKCMEHNAGSFHLIPEFRDFASKLGIKGEVAHYDSDDELDVDNDGDDKKRLPGSIDKSTVLVYYEKSAAKKVGYGPNEKINKKDQDQYAFLNLKKNKNWRKMLDDAWPTIFTIDQMKWETVEHYYQGAKFKKHHPDFYKMFSLDSNSDFCKDVALAKIAGSKEGSYKKGSQMVQLRPQMIRVDPDFYGPRRSEEREKALYAKFSQNLDLKEVLMATHDATLKRFIPKEKPELDIELMTVRKRVAVE